MSNRLTLNITRPGLGYRIGDHGGIEFLVSGQFGLQALLGTTREFNPSAGLDVLHWLSDDSAIVGSVRFYTVMDLFDRDPTRPFLEELTFLGRVGFTHTIAQRLTLTLSVGVGSDMEFFGPERENESEFVLNLLGPTPKGVLEDPVVRLHVVNWFHIDGNIGAAIFPQSSKAELRGTIGLNLYLVTLSF